MCCTQPINTFHIARHGQAQQRGALHSHILVWFRKRRPHDNWTALPCVERVVSGSGPKQRRHESGGSGLPPLHQHRLQYDSSYQLNEMGRVSAEMVRPIVTPRDFGGYDIESLRIAALARTILIRLKCPVVARIWVCLTYARHMRAYVTCGVCHMRGMCGIWRHALILFLLNPCRRDHLVLARLQSHILPEGRRHSMCYGMSLTSVHNTHPHAYALPTSCSYLPCVPRVILSVLAMRARGLLLYAHIAQDLSLIHI